jgi:pullulanase
MTFLSSHDTTRILTELGREIDDTVKALKLASAIQFFLPGMPSIYYGDEVGMTGGSDPYNRGYFCPTANADELTAHYKYLTSLRNTSHALQNGDLTITLDGDTITVTRSLENESISLTFDHINLTYEIK